MCLTPVFHTYCNDLDNASCDSLCVSLFCVRFTPNERNTRKAARPAPGVQLGARIFARTPHALSRCGVLCVQKKRGVSGRSFISASALLYPGGEGDALHQHPVD